MIGMPKAGVAGARVAMDLSGTSLGEVKAVKTGDYQKWADSEPVRAEGRG